jgi:hypothetical protein
MALRSLAYTLLISTLLSRGVSAATIWSEGVNGDLSGNRAAPTALAVASGTNTISGSTTGGDLDYFTFTVPAGSTFTNLRLASFGATNLAFLAIQPGSAITENPGAPVAANLLGYVHLGPALVGTDILDNMAASNGLSPPAQGFSLPLGPGSYAFWLQQANATPTSYSLDLVIAPEPASAGLVAAGLASLAARRRR